MLRSSAWAHSDNPAYAEYHWHDLQLLAGNLELLAGLALFAVPLVAVFRPRGAMPSAPTARQRHGTHGAAAYRRPDHRT